MTSRSSRVAQVALGEASSNLCAHYGVKSGGHDALEDARAAVEVFFEQVLFNNAGQMALDLMAMPHVHEHQMHRFVSNRRSYCR